MEVEVKSYTLDLLDSLVVGMLSSKENRGFTRLKNGLFEDAIGQVFTVELTQKKTVDEEANETLHVVLKMKPVSIVGAL